MEKAGLARGDGGGGEGGDGVDRGHYSRMYASFSADKAPRRHPADPEVGLTSRETSGETSSREEHLCSRRLEAQRGRNSLGRQEISADGLCQ